MDGIALVAALLGAIWPTGVVIALLRRTAPVTLADLVTFGRVLLTGVICAAAVFVFAGALPERTWTVAILAGAALLLDAVDGQVARRTGTSTASGARFDMEADAVLLLVLSALAALTVGWWVVAIGLLRYLFVVAGWIRPRLRGDLPFDQSRRVIAATQGVVLLVVLLPLTPVPVAIACAAVALGLLIWSFARDIVRLERSERSEHEYA